MALTNSLLEELEAQWERNMRQWRMRGGARVFIVEVPPDMNRLSYHGLGERPPTLRGTDLVQGLAQLALEWGDRRFAECVRALFELGIINKQTHGFTKKRGPYAQSQSQTDKADAAAKVQSLRDKDPNLSEREACAMVAADFVPAATFEAAFEQVRNASRQARRVGK
jgi:hypothetical protein